MRRIWEGRTRARITAAAGVENKDSFPRPSATTLKEPGDSQRQTNRTGKRRVRRKGRAGKGPCMDNLFISRRSKKIRTRLKSREVTKDWSIRLSILFLMIVSDSCLVLLPSSMWLSFNSALSVEYLNAVETDHTTQRRREGEKEKETNTKHRNKPLRRLMFVTQCSCAAIKNVPKRTDSQWPNLIETAKPFIVRREKFSTVHRKEGVWMQIHSSNNA